MAKKTITILTDDIDGTELPAGSRSTRFALDGVEYEIDLSAENARALADALAPYIAAGRRVGGSRAASAPRTRSRSTGKDADRLAAIRAWAQGNGYTVGDRGRIKAEIVEAYEAANG
ncbi:MAG: Lsr2 family protein [Microbacteriaceae bacterium]|nr:MAG: Lsr2 family protein [Microbacteriaceae bacterium]